MGPTLTDMESATVAENPAETTEAEVPDTETPEGQQQPEGQVDYKAEAEKWKALARQHEGRAKANAEAAQKIQALEDAQKSETEKLQDKVAKAEARASAMESENIRLRVAIRHGMTLDQVARLVGETEEDLDADAVEFLKMLRPETEEPEEEGAQAPTAPRPRVKSGAPGSYGIGNDDALLRDLKAKVGAR